MAKIKNELSQAQKTVFTLEDSEKMLRERLADEKHRSLTLEKVASIQKQKSLPKVNGGYSALDERPAHLVRRYGELYSQLRLETLDSLDKLPPLVNSDELKIKLLFSVVVVSFFIWFFWRIHQMVSPIFLTNFEEVCWLVYSFVNVKNNIDFRQKQM